MKIMLVDDEPLVRTSMARMIAHLEPSHSIFEAEDGEDAIHMLEAEAYDLVVTDIRMPAVNGLELSHTIQERWPETIVVMLTGYADFQYAQEAIRYNVKEYLLKPVSIDHLRRVIAQVEEELGRRNASKVVDKLRSRSLLEKRVQDLFYELPLPYYDESLFPPFDRFALLSFSVSAEGDRERTARFSLKNVIEDVFAPFGAPVVVVSDQAVTAVLFVSGKDGEPLIEDAALEALADTVPDVAKRVVKLDVVGSFGGVSAQLQDIKALYLASLKTLGAPQEPEFEPEPEPSPPPEEQVHRIVRSALELIQDRYAEDLTLTSIAESLYVSPNYLSSLFKSQTGSTFTHHLTKARMTKAKQLLRETNLKIYAICEQVGYADQAHFSRMFKTLEGMSPYDYRTKANI
ncbi:response regulator transcription factor [Paenibacillus antri]|nr:response regulator [Paenibacillus antri]